MGRGRTKCHSCNLKKKRSRYKKVIRAIVGCYCWRCGYGGEHITGVLQLHHVYPEQKLFALSSTDAGVKAIKDIIEELKKCVCLCPNCHSEYHWANTISDEEMIKLYNDKWEYINKYIDYEQIIADNYDVKLIHK